MIKVRRLRWADQIARMGEGGRSAFETLAGKSIRKSLGVDGRIVLECTVKNKY